MKAIESFKVGGIQVEVFTNGSILVSNRYGRSQTFYDINDALKFARELEHNTPDGDLDVK